MPRNNEPPSFLDGLRRIVGADGVLDQPEDMLVYEYDGSIDRALPQAVVFPTTAEQVSAVVKLATAHGVPMVPRGAGTGLSGGALAVQGGIVISTTRMTKILEVNVRDQIAVVEPGLINLKLSQAVAKFGLHYVPDPSSQKTCTIGGNVAENSGGPHCLAYGVTTNHVLGMEVVLPDGEITWLGGKQQGLPGYDLTGCFIGSEGTMGLATKIVVRLVRDPEAIGTLLAVFDQMDQATETVSAIIGEGIIPAALEMIDNTAIEAVRPIMREPFPADAAAVLLVEVEGLKETVAEDLAAVEDVCRRMGARELRQATSPEQREELWTARKGAIGALGRIAPNYYILDGVVPRTRLPEVLRRVGEIGQRYKFRVANVFHAGDGNLHPCIAFDERIPGESQRVLACGAEIMRLCVEVGGSITGEHGVGLEKIEFMHLLFTEADLAAMQKLRAAFGPTDVFNPCKIFPSGAGCFDGWKLPRLPALSQDMFV